MALSGTRDASDTAATLTADILRKLQVTGIGESPSAEDAAAVLRAIRHMLRTWGRNGVMLWLTQDQTVTPVLATSSYALSIRSIDVLQGWRRTTGNDMPLRMFTREEYNRLPNKTSSGSPFAYYVDKDRTATNVILYPVPDASSVAADSFRFTCRVPVQDALEGSQDIDLPPEWTEAIIWNAAARLLPEYHGQDGQSVQIIMQMAKETYDILAGGDREGSLFLRPSRY
jgi:hypothetical protein